MDLNAFLGTIGLLLLAIGLVFIWRKSLWQLADMKSAPWILFLAGAAIAGVGIALGYQMGEVWLIQQY